MLRAILWVASLLITPRGFGLPVPLPPILPLALGGIFGEHLWAWVFAIVAVALIGRKWS